MCISLLFFSEIISVPKTTLLPVPEERRITSQQGDEIMAFYLEVPFLNRYPLSHKCQLGK